jgi:hypothetical protein
MLIYTFGKKGQVSTRSKEVASCCTKKLNIITTQKNIMKRNGTCASQNNNFKRTLTFNEVFKLRRSSLVCSIDAIHKSICWICTMKSFFKKCNFTMYILIKILVCTSNLLSSFTCWSFDNLGFIPVAKIVNPLVSHGEGLPYAPPV